MAPALHGLHLMQPTRCAIVRKGTCFFCFLVFPFLFPSLPFPSFFSPPLPSVLPPSFPRLSNVSATAPVQVPTPSPPASHADADPAVAEYVLLPPAGLHATLRSSPASSNAQQRPWQSETADSARATLALACTPANGAPTRAADRVPTQTARTHRQRARAPAHPCPHGGQRTTRMRRTTRVRRTSPRARPTVLPRAQLTGCPRRQRARTDSARRTARAPRWRWHAHHPHVSHPPACPARARTHEPACTANGAPTRAADRVPTQTARTHRQRARAPTADSARARTHGEQRTHERGDGRAHVRHAHARGGQRAAMLRYVQ
ncbi:hypothetical protein GGX14DRAFT_580264 [Mycena pura]|uniref:Uncharacterized protein n=1 Tax=Mycena pura TaxID=153505 RepID=A0AAD6UTE7_9AGAR|nr:hypothetical protein GGX14DRAFT_580264 [Mycena pura]